MARISGRVTVVADSHQEYLGLLSAVANSTEFTVVVEDEPELKIVVDVAT